MMRYNPIAVYMPGKQLIIADKLSRHPHFTVTQEIAELTSKIVAYEEAVYESWPISPTKLNMVKQQPLQDAKLKMV